MAEIPFPRITMNELRFIADNVPAMISYIDASLRFCFVNAEYGRWLGVRPESLVGKRIDEVLGRDVAQKRMPYVEQVLHGEKVTFEAVLKKHTGVLHRVKISYTPDIIPDDGEVTGFVVLLVDLGAAPPETSPS